MNLLIKFVYNVFFQSILEAGNLKLYKFRVTMGEQSQTANSPYLPNL